MLKRLLIVISNILFWSVTTLFFVNFTFIRPRISFAYLELIILSLVIISVYLNYFVIYPRYFKQSRIKYWTLSLGVTLLVSIIELFLFKVDIASIYHGIPNHIYITFFFILLRNMAFILGSLYFSHTKAIRMEQKREIEQLEKELAWEQEKYGIESEYMRYKIAPHFLYNIVNHLFYCAIEQKEELPDLFRKLSNILDYYMTDSSKPLVPIEGEFNFYKKYVELENERYGNKVDVSIEFDHYKGDVLIAPLLFESYIGNAFKYTPHDGTGKVEVLFSMLDEDTIKFTCKNNKQQNEKKENYISTKNGISFNRRRLEFLYRSDYHLDIAEDEECYFVEMIIRVKKPGELLGTNWE